MAVSLSVVVAKDGVGTTIAGGLQAQDKSGTGAGPFTLGHIIIDGLVGTNMAAVTAANAMKVDGSAVTQPVSLTSTTVTGSVTVAQATAASLNATVVGTGTFAVQATQTGTWTVQPGNTPNTTAWKVDGSAVTQPVSLSTVAVTNAGTFAVQVSNANANGRALPTASAPVVLNSMTYTPIAASQTAALFGATGATGDYLDGVLVVPATAAAGVVSVTDGSGSAITIFAGGGTTALPTLAPFYVPIGAISKNGAGGWKTTTGTNVSVIGIGNFT